MPLFYIVAPAPAEVATTAHARPGNKTRGRTRCIHSLLTVARVISRLPRKTTAFLAMVGTLLAPLSATANGPRVTLNTTQGDIVLELDEDLAPQTVKNFLEYVDGGFYDDTLFHRVIDGFMIQGGGFNKDYQKKSTRSPVSNEAYNGLRNRRYTIAMARTTAPHSATSQFFINSENNGNLDHTNTSQRGWGYAVFGRVVEGQDVVDAISRVRTGPGGPFSRDVPIEPVVILSASRIQQSGEAAAGNTHGDNASESVSSSTSSQQTPRSKSDLQADRQANHRADSDPLQPVEQN